MQKRELTREAVEVAVFIAKKTPNDSMLKVAKFKAQKAQLCITARVLEESENALIPKPSIASKIFRYVFFGFSKKNLGFNF